MERALLYCVESSPVSIVVGDPVGSPVYSVPLLVRRERVLVVSELDVRSVAARLSGGQVGGTVGYSVPFESVETQGTAVKCVSGQMLVREALVDPMLARYESVVVHDIDLMQMWTDVALGVLLKVLIARRDSLRLVLTSGTSDGVERYASFFRESFPGLKIVSLESDIQPVDALFAAEEMAFSVPQVVKHAIRIATANSSDNTLVLVPTKKMAIEAAEGVNSHFRGDGPRVLIHYRGDHSDLPPIHSPFILFWGNPIERLGLPESYLQAISVVIDSGHHQVKRYAKGSVSISNEPISRTMALQRQSLAGVSHPGKCFHLSPLESLPAQRSPEILHADISEPVLALLSLGFSNLARSKIFVHNPSPESMAAALTKLSAFHFISAKGEVTAEGIVAAKLPIPPEFARAITVAQQKSCVRELLLITAASLAGGVEALIASPEHRIKFAAVEGDHLTALNVMAACADGNPGRSMGLNPGVVAKARSIFTQLSGYAATNGLVSNSIPAKPESILQCLAAGFVFNVAKRKTVRDYELVNGDSAILHKSSVLHEVNDSLGLSPSHRPSPWCIYEELSQVPATLALKMVSTIDRSMLPEGVYTS